MSIVAVIQARMSSQRLPRKVLTPIAGRPLLEHLLLRLDRSRSIEQRVLATSVDPSDDELADWATRRGETVVRGPLDDVLERFVMAIHLTSARTVIRVTGDNPLTSAESIDRTVSALAERGGDYAAETGLPVGAAAEVVRASALTRSARHTEEIRHREHVTLYIRENPDVFQILTMPAPATVRRPHYRLTVDEPADLELMQLVFRHLGTGAPPPLEVVIAFLDANPGVAALNNGVSQFVP
ncbi:MAG: glycosyltransferase family protein [Candidatus Schekmanbacteria bacterium]|nr:glycosyltransferase family protein [Candidatus Schekmanbacteria bacterium]